MSVNQTVENVYLRQDATQLTRKFFWPLLGIVLIYTLLPSLLEVALTALGDQLMIPEITAVTEQIAYLSSAEHLTSSEPALQAITDLFMSPKFILFNLAYILVTGIFRAGLGLGVSKQVIDVARGGTPRIRGSFGRMRYCFKAWRLQIWTYIKITLWMLPGFLLLLLGAEMLLYDHDSLGNLLMFAGLGLMIGLVIPSLYRYVMATSILADEPDRGVRDCVNFSKGLMEGRKWQYFRLGVPAWASIFGITFLVDLIGSLVMTALGLETTPMTNTVISCITTVTTIYFSIQLYLLDPLFYLKRRQLHSSVYESSWVDTLAKADPAKAAPISTWLAEHTAIEPGDAAEAPDTPEESSEDSPEDTSPETNEKKENHDEQLVC